MYFVYQGPISTLLQQMTIPSTLLISIFIFRTRFFFWHYLGAFVVLAGVLVTLGPDVKGLVGAKVSESRVGDGY